jgi:succinyl-diaminopimelate desuccinylase
MSSVSETGRYSVSAVEREIEREIGARRQELVALCEKMVAAPSMNPPGRTAEVASVVHDYLKERGVRVEIVAADDEAPNVIASVNGARGQGSHVVFNGHMDTMQAGDENAWTVPVLQLTRREGRLYGLGMGNMKGGTAAMALATCVLNQHTSDIGGRLSFAAVSDEVMFGNRGTEFLLKNRPDLLGDFMISGEGPGHMGFAIAEKGLLWADVEAVGSPGHSSRALRGETAVAKLAAFLTKLDLLNETFATVPPELTGIDGGEGNVGLRLSASTGVITTGSIRSLISPKAAAQVDIRLPPGISIPEVKERVEALAAESGVSVVFPKGWTANWAALDNPLVVEFTEVAEQVRAKKIKYVVRLPGSDARHWRDAGVPAVCFGPQPTLSAGVDDYAYEDDVVDCAKIYARVALRLMARSSST